MSYLPLLPALLISGKIQTQAPSQSQERLFLRIVGPAHLGKIDAEGIHVEAVEEAGETFAKTRQALVHELEVHHVGFEVGHGIRQLGEGRLEGVEREWGIAVDALSGGLAEG